MIQRMRRGSGGGLGGLDSPSGMRLTVQSNGAIVEEDGAAVGTLYLTPYTSNRIVLPDTSGVWAERTVTNIPSVSLAALTVGQCVDIFARWNAGAVELALLPSSVWTSAFLRGSAPLTLDPTTGLWVNGFGTGTYLAVGCVQATGAGVTRDSKANGRYVCNAFNRLTRIVGQVKGAGTWNESSATYVQANGGAAWSRVDWMEFRPKISAVVKGSGGGGVVRAQFHLRVYGNATASQPFAAIGTSTTVADPECQGASCAIQVAADGATLRAHLEKRAQVEGQQTLYAIVRFNGGAGSQQFSGDATPAESSGLFATVEV